MDSKGNLYELSDSEKYSMEGKLQERLVRVPLRDEVKVKQMTASQRKSYAKQLRKRRARAATARKARRKNRR